MAMLREAASSQHMLQFLARAGDIHHAAVIRPGGEEADKTGFPGQLTFCVRVPHEQHVHISRPVH